MALSRRFTKLTSPVVSGQMLAMRSESRANHGDPKAFNECLESLVIDILPSRGAVRLHT
jgi:hypothetical protein